MGNKELSNKLLKKAISLIKQGEVIAIPTETVYGLAGSALSKKALKTIFKMKKRPLFNPLIIHCCGQKQMQIFHTVRHKVLNKLIKHFCPGPLTFVLNKSQKVDPLITAGKAKVALRIPNHPLTLKLIKQSKMALCAPSANLYGKLSPTSAVHVQKNFNDLFILDGGACDVGIESTVIEPDFNLQVLKILRPGIISQTQLLKMLYKENLKHWKVQYASSHLSPGQSKNHYQPETDLVLIKTTQTQTPSVTKIKKHILLHYKKQNKTFKTKPLFKKLKLRSTAFLTARTLYQDLSVLSKNSKNIIYVCQTKKNNTPAWHAIWDRLEKAATFYLNIE